MAYNAVAQTDEVASNATGSDRDGSPPPALLNSQPFQPISLDFDNL
jgi:hypothetical protein